MLPDGTKIFLVDTPGFDDTNKLDSDILRELAGWLSKAYSSKIELTGIIYLHRITDVRMGGANMRNLRMFKKLCGDSSLGSVVLATTMWSEIAEPIAIQREEELRSRPDFWKRMIDQGSTVFRHDDQKQSAVKIIQYLISRRKRVVLDIQHDMVDKGMTLDQTAAGQEVQGEIVKLREYYEKQIKEIREEMKEVIDAKDKEAEEILRSLRSEMNGMEAKMEKTREDLVKMCADKDQLKEQLDKQYEQERERMLNDILQNEKKIAQNEFEIDSLRAKHATDLEIQRLKHELAAKEAEKERLRRLYNSRICAVM